MASKGPDQGRLIAVEGTRGADLAPAAERLLRHYGKGGRGGGISQWDASGAFFDLLLGKHKILTPSPRTLLLLYAYDLVFRLRWQIRPALEEGKCVIAAPYVESAMAFGVSVGLPKSWLDYVFSFAPKPYACYRTKEKKKKKPPGKGKPSDGYLEFCFTALRASSAGWDPAELRGRSIAYLDEMERSGGCRKVTKHL